MDVSSLLMPEDYLQVYDASDGVHAVAGHDLLVDDVDVQTVVEVLAEDVTDQCHAQLAHVVRLDHAYCRPPAADAEEPAAAPPPDQLVAAMVPFVEEKDGSTSAAIPVATTTPVTTGATPPTKKAPATRSVTAAAAAAASPGTSRAKTHVQDSPAAATAVTTTSRQKPVVAPADSPQVVATPPVVTVVVTPKAVTRLTAASAAATSASISATDSGSDASANASPIRRSRRQMEKLEREQQAKGELESSPAINSKLPAIASPATVITAASISVESDSKNKIAVAAAGIPPVPVVKTDSSSPSSSTAKLLSPKIEPAAKILPQLLPVMIVAAELKPEVGEPQIASDVKAENLSTPLTGIEKLPTAIPANSLPSAPEALVADQNLPAPLADAQRVQVPVEEARNVAAPLSVTTKPLPALMENVPSFQAEVKNVEAASLLPIDAVKIAAVPEETGKVAALENVSDVAPAETVKAEETRRAGNEQETAAPLAEETDNASSESHAEIEKVLAEMEKVSPSTDTEKEPAHLAETVQNSSLPTEAVSTSPNSGGTIEADKMSPAAITALLAATELVDASAAAVEIERMASAAAVAEAEAPLAVLSSAASIYAAVDERLKIRAPPELPFEIMACDLPGEPRGPIMDGEDEAEVGGIEPRVFVRPLAELPAHFIPSAIDDHHDQSLMLDPRTMTSSLIGPDDAALLLAAVAAATAGTPSTVPTVGQHQSAVITSPSVAVTAAASPTKSRRSRELSLEEIDDGFGKVVQRRPSGGTKKTAETKTHADESPAVVGVTRKSYPKRENRKPPAHLMDMFEPPLFSKPDRMKKIDELADEPSDGGAPVATVAEKAAAAAAPRDEAGGAPKKTTEDIEDYLSRVDGDNVGAVDDAAADSKLVVATPHISSGATVDSASKTAGSVTNKKENRKPMPSRKGEFRRNRKDRKRRSALNRDKKGAAKDADGTVDANESDSSSGTGSTSETDSDWCSEDDPDRLWCICNQPHNDRFMISCDKCEDWYHGTCVGVSRRQGREWEKNGQEWTCPKCVRGAKLPTTKEKRPDPKPVTKAPTKSPAIAVASEKIPASADQTKTPTAVVAPARGQPTLVAPTTATVNNSNRSTPIKTSDIALLARQRPAKPLVTSPVKDRPMTSILTKDRSILRPVEAVALGSAKQTLISASESGPKDRAMIAALQQQQRLVRALQPGEKSVGRVLEIVVPKDAPASSSSSSLLQPSPSNVKTADGGGVKAQLCVVGCGRTARPNSIFCGNECILQKADESAKVAGKEKERKLGLKSLIKPEMKRDVASEQIMAIDKTTGKVITVPTAQNAAQLREWLRQHPTVQIVKTGKDPATAGVPQRNFYGQPQKTIKLIGAQQMIPVENLLEKSKAGAKATTFTTTATLQPTVEKKEIVSTVPVKKIVTEVRRVSADTKTKSATLSPGPKTVDPRKPRLSLSGATTGSPGSAAAAQPSTPAPQTGPEPIRENVQKTLRDVLVIRNKEIVDNRLQDDDIKKVADNIEEELFKIFPDVGFKYKSKYRSLMFNIKDQRNHGLFQKILRGKISPYKLVRMTPEELASKELAMWREREAKHTLEMIKREQEDQKHVPIIKKTHKGEIEIDEVDVGFSEKPSKPKVEYVPPEVASTPMVDTTEAHRSHLFDLNCKICTGQMLAPADVADPSAKKARVATSISMESRSQDEESEDDVAAKDRASKEAAIHSSSSSKTPPGGKNRDESSKASGKSTDTKEKDTSRKDKERSSSSGSLRDRDRDRSGDKNRSKSKSGGDTKSKSASSRSSESSDRSKTGGSGSSNRSSKDRSKNGSSSSSSGKSSVDRDKDKSRTGSRTVTTTKEKDRSKAASSKTMDASKSSKDAGKMSSKDRKRDKDKKATALAAASAGDNVHKEVETKGDKGKEESSKTSKRTSDVLDSNDPNKKTKKVKVDDSTTGGSTTGTLKTADDREPSSTTVSSPDSAVTSQSDVDSNSKSAQASVWKGFITMQDVAKFVTSAYKVSGPTDFLAQDIPDTIQVCGRIAPNTVWDYLSKVKQSGNKEFLVIRFNPANDEENVAFELFYTYLNSRNRFGVVGNCSKVIKDFYILPLGSDVPIPETLLPFEYFDGLDDSRTDTLLGVIIRHKGKTKTANGKSGKSSKKSRAAAAAKDNSPEVEVEIDNNDDEEDTSNDKDAPTPSAAKRVKFDLHVKTSVLVIEEDGDAPTTAATAEPERSYTPPLEDLPTPKLAASADDPASSSSPYDPSYTPPIRDTKDDGGDSPYSPGQSHPIAARPSAAHDDGDRPYDPEEEENVVAAGGGGAGAGGESTVGCAEQVSKSIIPGLLAGSVSSQSVSELIDQISMSANPTEITTTVLASIAHATNLEQQRKLLIELTHKVEEQKRQLEQQKQQIATKVTAQVIGAMANVASASGTPFTAAALVKSTAAVLSANTLAASNAALAMVAAPVVAPPIPKMVEPPTPISIADQSSRDAPYEPKDEDDEEAYSPSYTPPPMETNDDHDDVTTTATATASSKAEFPQPSLPLASATPTTPATLKLTDTSSISLPPNLKSILESIKKQAATSSEPPPEISAKPVVTILEDPIVKNFLTVDETERESEPPSSSSSSTTPLPPSKQSDPRLKIKAGPRLDPRRKVVANTTTAAAAEDRRKSELGSLSASELLEKAMKQFEDLSGNEAAGGDTSAAVAPSTSPPVAAETVNKPVSNEPLPPGLEPNLLSLSSIPVPPVLGHPVHMPPPNLYGHLSGAAPLPSSPVGIPSNFSVPPPNYLPPAFLGPQQQQQPPPHMFPPPFQPPPMPPFAPPPQQQQQQPSQLGGNGSPGGRFWPSGPPQDWHGSFRGGRGSGGGMGAGAWDSSGGGLRDYNSEAGQDSSRHGGGSSWENRRGGSDGRFGGLDRHHRNKSGEQQFGRFRQQERGLDRSARSRDVKKHNRERDDSSRDRSGRYERNKNRDRSRSPSRKRSRSPLRKQSRSPSRKLSRSPSRKLSRSPSRKLSRSPSRKLSRSPSRKLSRSPTRKLSRSPSRKLSRSPTRKLSRSPTRKSSRSPSRKLSRSPPRKLSRSPPRKFSRSPARKLSRSRSPDRNRSQSPDRKRPRSPDGQRSRSPTRGSSLSPIRGRSRSPMKARSRDRDGPTSRGRKRARSRSLSGDRNRSFGGVNKTRDRWSSDDHRFDVNRQSSVSADISSKSLEIAASADRDERAPIGEHLGSRADQASSSQIEISRPLVARDTSQITTEREISPIKEGSRLPSVDCPPLNERDVAQHADLIASQNPYQDVDHRKDICRDVDLRTDICGVELPPLPPPTSIIIEPEIQMLGDRDDR